MLIELFQKGSSEQVLIQIQHCFVFFSFDSIPRSKNDSLPLFVKQDKFADNDNLVIFSGSLSFVFVCYTVGDVVKQCN